MAFQCGTLSHVEVDENDVIWQLPPKKSAVRWPNSSSIATTISEVGGNRKQRPRGILKSSIKTRIQDGDNDDDRDCSSSLRTPQSSSSSTLFAQREDSCEEYYPLALLENAGNTPRGNHRPRLPPFESLKKKNHDLTNITSGCSENNHHRRRHHDRRQTPKTTQPRNKYCNKDINDQPTRRRRNYHHHHHPTACPICSGKLIYLQISSKKYNAHETRTNTDISIEFSHGASTAAALLATSVTLREIKQLDKEEDYHELLKNMCNMQSLMPPLCRACKTYIVFDDNIECKYDMMDNFDMWFLDIDDVEADDRDGGEGERREVIDEGDCTRATDRVDLDRSHAKIIVIDGGAPPPSPRPPSFSAAAAAAATAAALPRKTETTATTADMDSASNSASATTTHTTTIVPLIGEEFDTAKKCGDAAMHLGDIVTPRRSNCVGRSTADIDDVHGSFERGRTTSAPEQSFFAHSSTSESIQITRTESEERKILEDYSMMNEIASTELVKELMKGHRELVQSVCNRCKMPQIKQNGDTNNIICATCPSVHQKAKWIAKQKRVIMTEETKQQDKEHHDYEERIHPVEVSGKSEEDSEDGSAVVIATDTLTIEMETKHLNTLEEGLMGSNSNGECSDCLEISSQGSIHNRTDYWVRHSSSHLNDQNLSNPTSFHSQNSNTNYKIHQRPTTGMMQESVSELPPDHVLPQNQHTILASYTDVSKSCQSNSDESSTRCPLFSSSQDVLYRLEDEIGLSKRSEMGQILHHNHNTIDQDPILDVSPCRSSNHLIFETREVDNSPTIDLCRVTPTSKTATVDALYVDPSDHCYEEYDTSSEESSTRCPPNLPSNEMIWKYAVHDVSVDPMNSLSHEQESLNERALNSLAVTNKHEKKSYSIQNPWTVGRQDVVSGHDCLSRYKSNYQTTNNSEICSEEIVRRSRESTIGTQLSLTNFCDGSISGGVPNKTTSVRHTCRGSKRIGSDGSEASSEVSQIEDRDYKIMPPSRASLQYDCHGRASQDHYSSSSKVMSNEREHSNYSIVNSSTLGRLQSQEHQCKNKHQTSEDSEGSSDVSRIQHRSLDDHLHKNVVSHDREAVDNLQASSRVDIGVRIARLATSLKIFQHELPLNRSRIDTKDHTFTLHDKVDIQKKTRPTESIQPVRYIDHISYTHPNDSVASDVVSDANELKYSFTQHTISPARDVSVTEDDKRKVSTNSVHHPIFFWPLTDKIANSSYRIPISPITIGRADIRTLEGVPTNNCFMANNCDLSKNRTDPPGIRIEHLERESRLRPLSRNAIHDLNNRAKTANGKVYLSEDLTRLKMQKNDTEAGRYACMSRNSVTPKSKGRNSSSVVPTEVADKVDKSLLRVESWGESSVDKLMKQIDEIEDDFISIVASLPGSKDGTSLMSSTNSLKSANVHSLVEITLNIADSFDSQSSAVSLVTDAVHRMRRIKDRIYQNDSIDEGGGSDEDNSRGGMSELIQDLTNAAESLRTLSEWDE